MVDFYSCYAVVAVVMAVNEHNKQSSHLQDRDQEPPQSLPPFTPEYLPGNLQPADHIPATYLVRVLRHVRQLLKLGFTNELVCLIIAFDNSSLDAQTYLLL